MLVVVAPDVASMDQTQRENFRRVQPTDQFFKFFLRTPGIDMQRGAGADVTALTPAAAQDSDTITVTKATATKYNLSSIADLASVASKLIFGAPAAFQTRADGIPALQSVGLDPSDPNGATTAYITQELNRIFPVAMAHVVMDLLILFHHVMTVS